MSSIIACRLPPPEVSTPSTRRGVLSSEVRPIDWASRRAGSTVSTQAWRPRSAARRPMAAAAVVLPTPPEPQQTMIRVRRSSMIRSMSSLTGFTPCPPLACGAPRGASLLVWPPVAAGPRRSFLAPGVGPRGQTESSRRRCPGIACAARSCRPLFPEYGGQLIQPGQVDSVRDHRQLVVRQASGQQLLSLPVLQGHLLRVLSQLGHEVGGQAVVVADPGSLQADDELGDVEGSAGRGGEVGGAGDRRASLEDDAPGPDAPLG